MMKLRTKITLLVCSVVIAILLLNQYPVSMSLKQTVMKAGASALMDITTQLSSSLSAADGDFGKDTAVLRTLARQAEECTNCSGVAIFDDKFRLLYSTPGLKPDETALKKYKDELLQGKKQYDIVSEGKSDSLIYAACPIYRSDGTLQGSILSTLQYSSNHRELQKAQRDLNAMTVLVMLIALIFVWDLTDNVKGTMFNLEPVEIAQLLVERNILIDAVRDGILSVNQNGEITHANRTARLMFEKAGQPFDAGDAGFVTLFPQFSLQNILNGNQPIYDNERRLGTDSFYVNFIPIKISQPQHESLLVTFRPKQEVVRFAENITGVKSYVEALRAQMHEFNNKLQVVSGLVQAQNYTELETYIHGVVHLKNRELQQISGKIGDPTLAAFLASKFDRASEQRVDLVLTDRTELLGRLTEELLQDLILIVGNLLENAFDALQGCAMRTVALEIVETTEEIYISVWDSGPEIPEKLRENILEYGVTTKKDGNGIGLFLVNQACERYNGYITIVSEAGDGTEFTVHIPRMREEERHVPGIDC